MLKRYIRSKLYFSSQSYTEYPVLSNNMMKYLGVDLIRELRRSFSAQPASIISYVE